MKYDAVVFDLDGTLIDTLEDLMDSVNYALAEFGFPARTYEEIRTFVGNGVRRLVYLSVPEGTPDDVSEKCLDVFKAHYLHNSRTKTKPYKGIPELLKAIFAAGFKTAVVTNKMQDAAVDIVRGLFRRQHPCYHRSGRRRGAEARAGRRFGLRSTSSA